MTWADDMVERLGPWLTPDYEAVARAMMSMGAELEFYADDVIDDETGTVTAPGWSPMLDPTRAKTEGLPYLAMLAGEQLPAGLPDPDARQWILDRPHSWRGTPGSIVRAAKQWLTDSKTVQLLERTRLDGTADEDYITVRTLTRETPRPELVLQELRWVVPADIECEFATVTNL